MHERNTSAAMRPDRARSASHKPTQTITQQSYGLVTYSSHLPVWMADMLSEALAVTRRWSELVIEALEDGTCKRVW
jgi:hypothetical protein